MPDFVSRTELLQTLEAVRPGLSPAEASDQTNCFILRGGWVITFNEDTTCRARTKLPEDIELAVAATKLVQALHKMPDERVEVELADGKLSVYGEKTQTWASVATEKEIKAPLDAIPKPSGWRPLDPDFGEAVDMAQEACSNDKDEFITKCVHITPDHVEATDRYQACRYTLKTGFTENLLVERRHLKHVVLLGMTDWCRTGAWLHFKNPAGLYFSTVCVLEKFLDLGRVFDFQGEPATLPKSLIDVTALASVFAGDDPKGAKVVVGLRQGKGGGEVQVVGEGTGGEGGGTLECDYRGPPLLFRISPRLLTTIVKRQNEVEIGEGKMRVDGGGKWVYMTCLGHPGDRRTRPKADKGDDK